MDGCNISRQADVVLEEDKALTWEERKEITNSRAAERTSLVPEVSELSLMHGGQEFRHQRGAPSEESSLWVVNTSD